MEKQNRTRRLKLSFRVTDEERSNILERMQRSGYRSIEKYLRKMAIDGAIYNIDLKDIKEHTLALNRIGVNVNQIAKKGNEYRLDANDVKEVQRLMNELILGEKEIIKMAIAIRSMRDF